MQRYTVQVLNEKEWFNLPYKGLESSVGLADRNKGLAFVRNTGNKEYDLDTMTHEINHLLEAEPTDFDEDGICHKQHWYSKITRPFSNDGILAAGGVGGFLGDALAIGLAPFTGGASLGFMPLLSALGGAGQAAIQGNNILSGALQGFGAGGLGAGLGGGLLGGVEGAMGGGGLSGFGSGLLSGLESGANTFISGIPGFGAGGMLSGATGLGGMSFAPGAAGTTAGGLLGSTPAAASAANAASVGLPAANAPVTLSGSMGTTSPLVTPASSGIVAASGPSTGAGAAGGTSALTKALTDPKLLLGAGLTGASALLQQPQYQTPQSVTDLENQIKSGGTATALGAQSQAALQKLIATPPSSLNPALQADDPYFQSTFANMDNQFKNAKAQLDASFNANGQLGSGEYQDQLRQLTQSYNDAKNQYVAQENQSRYLTGQQQQLSAIQQALGVDQNTMNDLVGLSGIDAQTAAIKYGVDAQSVQQLRQIMGTVGGNILGAALK